MGAHSTFTQEKADEIALRLSNGEPLRQICRDESMPCWVTVYNWMDERPEFHALIARARARGEDSIAAECMEIADDSRNDYIDKLNAEGEVVGQQLNAEHVQRSKLRIETRLKLLAKWNPKKYGDRTVLAGDPDAPLASQVATPEVIAALAQMSPEQLRALASKPLKDAG